MLYPLIFNPIFKEIIWGGNDIMPFKGLPSDNKKIGESWELSHVPENYSVVANGTLKGKNIDELIKEFDAELLGKKVIDRTGNTFPLLIKFIDAKDDLSIQVHPGDELAKKRHNSFGKTEMWYVVKAAPGASLYSGFSKQINAGEYVKRLEDNTIMDVLKKYEVEPENVFFLPAGRVHAIGAGCFVAEIQQTSNVTYRIYDYRRKDKNGNERELHTELAKDAIDYTLYPDYRTEYTPLKDKAVELVKCNYFTTNILDLNKPLERDLTSIKSFIVYICLGGSVTLIDNNDYEILIHQGQTALIPANTSKVILRPANETKVLETFIN
jgi:mannose-6-phosphate isomerase